ncbi:GNAT family N-acetyltransferase [Rugamonas sp.]|uniref:GNAT family N-acetyltransferase n=1 Tax=Rugamonas sp. TaxID=1926287 RepID=UPI0025F9FC7F|nr:GNAT family N-acetyltransferase [Rugamonas sp.]
MTEPPTEKALLAFQKDAGWSVTRRESDTIRSPHSRAQWVSVEYQKVRIGIARLELAPPEFCYVSDLVIKSKFRRLGVGRWLLRHIEDLCIKLAIRRILLRPEPNSRAFYDSLSFVDDPMVPNILRKDLNPFQRKVQLAH